MEGDAGRDANKSFGYWSGLVTLRETENLKNKVRFFEYPSNAPLVEQVDTIALEAMLK